ncbi:hypothetical protein [uncultured Akkermansia sp.]|uniref:hypothetical protein n=1 Tax=uncultured Akkermansia sp. TaxID=512294 RepID=UPI00261A5696|nr:hypothetical protein [uncultured Akkermansia sp.]
MFILSCSAALACGLFPFAAGQSVASGDCGKKETAPGSGLECLQVTLLIRQMVLDRYDSTGTGILSDQDKARLVEDARAARREARKAFLRQFDKDGDGRLSPEEYRAFRQHVEKRRGGRRADAGPDKRDGIPLSPTGERRKIPPPPPPPEGMEMPLVEIRTVGKKRFMVAPGLFLLTRNMLLHHYDANGNGRIDPGEHAVVMKDAAALYQAKMKEMMELYDLDQDGVLSPVEREQALADSHEDSPLYSMEEPDDIDLFIRANISEVLLKESPVDAGDEKDKGTE